MRRRELIVLVGGAMVLVPLAVRAQQPRKVPKIGFLYPGSLEVARSRIEATLDGLRAAGYRESEHFQLIARVADNDGGKLPALATSLAEERVDVIIVVTTAAVRAVQAATQTIPIVAHDLETDPVAIGLIESYARPGGRVTGVFFDFPNFRTKWLELIREAIPGLTHIAILWHPLTGDAQLKAVETAAHQLGLKAIIVGVDGTKDLDNAVQRVKEAGVDALLILSSPLFGTQPKLLADLALHHKLPAVTLFPDFARAGGLMAYGPNLPETYRPIPVMVGKILGGAIPSDLPVERPSKFELVVNVQAAKALGVAVPASILQRADEVIE